MSLLDKIFGTESERKLKKIMPLVEAIEDKAEQYAAMSDDEFAARAYAWRGRPPILRNLTLIEKGDTE